VRPGPTGSFQDRIEVGGRWYDLVCVRRTGAAVYRGDGTYLRVGSATLDELVVHRRLLAEGYPVAELLDVGEHAGAPYFVEASLGQDTWGDVHEQRIGAGHRITDREFWALGDVLLRWGHAQVRVERRAWSRHDLVDLLGVHRATEHVPELAAAILTAFDQAVAELADLPGAWQHDDLHAFNACAGGVIDVEGVAWGPAGYDVATAVLEPSISDARWEAGALVLAWFTADQVRDFLGRLDHEFRSAGAPGPSTYLDALLICRAIGICSHLHPDAAVMSRRRDTLARLLPAFLETGHLPLQLER